MSSAPASTLLPTYGRPARASRIGDRRGLTATGGVLLLTLLASAGAAYDVVTGNGLRVVFALCFVVGCAFVTLVVHREDLFASVVMPPLVYVVVALGGGAVESTGDGGSFLAKQALEVVNALVLGAPVLLGGTAVALVLALLRRIGGRRS